MGIQLNLNSNMISVSSSYIGNASSLVDGNLTTQWVSYGGGSSTWIKISLNKIYDISEIKFLTEADTFYTSGCDIYISMDDIIYTKINPKNYTYTNYWADYNISSISTKFIKLTNFINSKDSYTRIYELEIFISPKYYLINDNNQYKYFNKTTFLMGNVTNNPPTATDYRAYGNEDLSYLCTSYNQEVLQMTNFTTLGSGKYGYVNCNNKILNVISVNLKTTGTTTPTYKKYLVQDNTTNEIYTYNGTTLVQATSQTLDEPNFRTNGFNDLTVVTNAMWTSIFTDITHARILYYTDDTLITENDLTCNINSYRPIDDLQNNFTYYLFKDNS